ncbi:MAG: hypothetical protein KA159_08685, partial [Halioglobus sp.]|nr:hypothetical protein [Halioglobus sp.]
MIRLLLARGRVPLFALLALAAPAAFAANIPATAVMTLYRFNGDLNLPYYDIERFAASGPREPAGTLVQGTTLIPCLALRNGRPLTDREGTPFVGFELVVDPRNAQPESSARVKDAIAQRKELTVANHHCGVDVRHVIDVRNLYPMEKVPFFDPPRGAHSAAAAAPADASPADLIVRAFHNADQCAQANTALTGRRAAL